MADNAVERLQREVAAVQDVEHANALHVVEEPPPGALVEDVVQEPLAGVAKRRVADVVAQRDGLDEVQVEPQRQADVSRHAAHELHVQATARDVVVCAQREDLRLAREAVVGRQVDDLLGVTHEGGALGRATIALNVKASTGRRVGRGMRAERAGAPLGENGLGHVGRKAASKLGGAEVHEGRHGVTYSSSRENMEMVWPIGVSSTDGVAGLFAPRACSATDVGAAAWVPPAPRLPPAP